MNRLLIALATLAFGLPAQAASISDFNPSNASVGRSLDGQCYSTRDQSKVCFLRITGEAFAVSVRESAQEYAHVFTVDCNSGRFRGFGPMSNEQNASMATNFCENGRF